MSPRSKITFPRFHRASPTDIPRRSALHCVISFTSKSSSTTMVNLLPPTEKKKLQRENRMRLSVLILWVTLALEALVALLFLPSYYAVSANIKNLTMRLGEEKLLIPTGGEVVEATLKSMGEEVALIKPLTSEATQHSALFLLS